MRVAYITNSTEGGGAALPIPAVTRVLRDQGAQVRVFALEKRDGRALPALLAAGLDPLVRPNGGRSDHLQALRWLDRETRAWGATHLWTALSRSAALGLLLSRRRNLPTFCWLMNALPKTGNRLVLRALQARAGAWIAVSDSTAELARKVLRVHEDRVLTWPIYAADPLAPTAMPWEPGEPIRIGSLGRLHPVKGYDVLIAALARLRREGFSPTAGFKVTIAGEGAGRARLEAAARAAGVDSLLMPGYTDHPARFLASQHLYVQPSRSEGFCVAVQEAMVAGLPVVVSAVGDLPQTVEQGATGLVVPPEDPVALADALFRLLSRPALLYPMGVTARLRVLERYSTQKFTAAGVDLFERMVSASAAGHTTSRDPSGLRA